MIKTDHNLVFTSIFYWGCTPKASNFTNILKKTNKKTKTSQHPFTYNRFLYIFHLTETRIINPFAKRRQKWVVEKILKFDSGVTDPARIDNTFPVIGMIIGTT